MSYIKLTPFAEEDFYKWVKDVKFKSIKETIKSLIGRPYMEVCNQIQHLNDFEKSIKLKYFVSCRVREDIDMFSEYNYKDFKNVLDDFVFNVCYPQDGMEELVGVRAKWHHQWCSIDDSKS